MKRKNQLHIAREFLHSRTGKWWLIFRAWRKMQGKAQGKLSRALKNNLYRRASDYYCVDCGNTAHGYDHRDYLKPFTVAPVCAGCNWHRGSAKQVFISWEKWESIASKIDLLKPPKKLTLPKNAKLIKKRK